MYKPSRVFQYVLEWTPVNEAHLDPDFVEAAGPLADLAKKRDRETRRIEIPATEITTYTLEHAVPASSYSCIARRLVCLLCFKMLLKQFHTIKSTHSSTLSNAS